MELSKQPLKSGHVCCGAGGDIVGAKAAGIQPVWAFDKNASAVETVMANHSDINAFMSDIRTINVQLLEPVDILFCGIPCQPYTRIGRRRLEEDERAISKDITRVVVALKPQYLLFENVREYQRSAGFDFLNAELSAYGYRIAWQIVNVADYGIPQRRKRLFGLGVCGADHTPQFPLPTHTKERNLFDQRYSWIKFGAIKDGVGMKPLSACALRGILRHLRKHSESWSGFSVQIIDENDMMMTVLGTMWRGSRHSTLIWDNGIIRNVSLLEARRAQGFDDSYVFCGTEKEKWKLIADAWPPIMVTWLIESLVGVEDFQPLH